ncbi:hypothetical protein [Dermacoccus sp. Tok2021]|uniref:hypothetical protein n=1 Tax=Dermacoccus sp. Tok2021 TaxID=2826873 RepID=UPI001CEDE021|nr:hypothetical protein [Dermacoccus sp. Tok2021]MBZ4497589.1 hypothetical protein [Dermacoccus sp. Tok2021]
MAQVCRFDEEPRAGLGLPCCLPHGCLADRREEVDLALTIGVYTDDAARRRFGSAASSGLTSADARQFEALWAVGGADRCRRDGCGRVLRFVLCIGRALIRLCLGVRVVRGRG